MAKQKDKPPTHIGVCVRHGYRGKRTETMVRIRETPKFWIEAGPSGRKWPKEPRRHYGGDPNQPEALRRRDRSTWDTYTDVLLVDTIRTMTRAELREPLERRHEHAKKLLENAQQRLERAEEERNNAFNDALAARSALTEFDREYPEPKE